MKLGSIAYYIESLGLGSVGGEDRLIPAIFVNQIPSSFNNSDTILLNPPMDGMPTDEETPNYYKGFFQIVVSAHDYQTAEQISDQIYSQLNLGNLELEDMTIKQLRPRHLPLMFKRNEGNRVEFSINFYIVFQLAS